MALSFKVNMEFESNIKQVKTYLKKVLLMKEHQAQTNADKINLACRVYKNLDEIANNCTNSGVDIIIFERTVTSQKSVVGNTKEIFAKNSY